MTRQQSETAAALRLMARTATTAALRSMARTDEERYRVELIISEVDRAARAIDEARAEDVRRAASGRRVLG